MAGADVLLQQTMFSFYLWLHNLSILQMQGTHPLIRSGCSLPPSYLLLLS